MVYKNNIRTTTKVKLIETGSRKVVSKGWGRGAGALLVRAQASSCRRTGSEDQMDSTVSLRNNIVLYTRVSLRWWILSILTTTEKELLVTA